MKIDERKSIVTTRCTAWNRFCIRWVTHVKVQVPRSHRQRCRWQASDDPRCQTSESTETENTHTKKFCNQFFFPCASPPRAPALDPSFSLQSAVGFRRRHPIAVNETSCAALAGNLPLFTYNFGSVLRTEPSGHFQVSTVAQGQEEPWNGSYGWCLWGCLSGMYLSIWPMLGFAVHRYYSNLVFPRCFRI
jgi:hypothetical protein